MAVLTSSSERRKRALHTFHVSASSAVLVLLSVLLSNNLFCLHFLHCHFVARLEHSPAPLSTRALFLFSLALSRRFYLCMHLSSALPIRVLAMIVVTCSRHSLLCGLAALPYDVSGANPG